MRAELARLHARLGVTTVYVTHDQIEAMTLGDRVCVMLDGTDPAVDTPQRLFTPPANTFVAATIGSPPMNLAAARNARAGCGWRASRLLLANGAAAAALPVIAAWRRTDLKPGGERTVGMPRGRQRLEVVERLGLRST